MFHYGALPSVRRICVGDEPTTMYEIILSLDSSWDSSLVMLYYLSGGEKPANRSCGTGHGPAAKKYILGIAGNTGENVATC